MTIRKAFDKGIDRSAPGSVTQAIDDAKRAKAASLVDEARAIQETIVDPVETSLVKRNEMEGATTDLRTAIDELIETLALMKHPNQRPALRKIAQEPTDVGAGYAVRVATLADQLRRAVTEFKKGGA